MEKIQQLNKILIDYLKLDIFNSIDNESLKNKIMHGIEKYLVSSCKLNEIIKTIYGDDIEISYEIIELEEVPSQLHNLINLKKNNYNLTLTLADLGYTNVSIKYYINKKNSDETIYIGTYKGVVKKYSQIVSEIGYMCKLEEVLNIKLIPNVEHTKVIYKKEQVLPVYYDINSPKGSYVEADFKNYQTIIDDVKITKAIKTHNNRVICKSIDCTHKNGYSTDLFEPSNFDLEFDLRKNEPFISLIDVSPDISEKIKAFLLFPLLEQIMVNLCVYSKSVIERAENSIFKDRYFNFDNSRGNYNKIEQILNKYFDSVNLQYNIESIKNFQLLVKKRKKQILASNKKTLLEIKGSLRKDNGSLERHKIKIKQLNEKLTEIISELSDSYESAFVREACYLASTFKSFLSEDYYIDLANIRESLNNFEECFSYFKKQIKVMKSYESFDSVPSEIVNYLYDSGYLDRNLKESQDFPFYSIEMVIDLIKKNLDILDKLPTIEKSIGENEEKLEDIEFGIEEIETDFYYLNDYLETRNKLLYICENFKKEIFDLITIFDKVASLANFDVAEFPDYQNLKMFIERIKQINESYLFSDNKCEQTGNFVINSHQFVKKITN